MNTKEDERLLAQSLLAKGMKPKDIANQLHVHISTIYNWKKEMTVKNESRKNFNNFVSKTKEEMKTESKNDKRTIDLQQENQALKQKVRDLENIIADLAIKLKRENKEWLK
ncbi:helix-turn-helix domain-containing protein [Priestia sp. GS2]|uniref:helix-turn-helix domain-containing protein n=1 Tax=Priestia sp. GS2 TaxID=3117403 RepID=UPI002ED81D89